MCLVCVDWVVGVGVLVVYWLFLFVVVFVVGGFGGYGVVCVVI